MVIRKRVEEGDMEGANNMKRKLPMFLFMAGAIDEHVYEGTSAQHKGQRGFWRSQKHTWLNGLVMLDFDDLDGQSPRDVFFKLVQPHADEIGLMLAHVTPKGHGLRLVCKADTSVGNLADNQAHLAQLLGLKIDGVCKDSSRGSFVPTDDDILFIDNLIFTYENPEYDKKYGDAYRLGNSRNTHSVIHDSNLARAAVEHESTEDVGNVEVETSRTTGNDNVITLEKDDEGNFRFGGPTGLKYSEIQDALWSAYGGRPQVGTRHTGVLSMAGRLRYICDNNARNIRAVIDDCGLPAEEVQGIIDSVVAKPMASFIPPKMRQVIEGLCQQRNVPSPFRTADGGSGSNGNGIEKAVPVNYEYWNNRLKPLLCRGLDDAVSTLPPDVRIGGAMAACAMFGTYLTRCTFLHGDGEQRRLSFLVYIIGLPASGKSFLPVLDKLIMEPMRVADENGRRQEQQYKEDLKKRESSSRNQKESAQDVPHPVIRYVPSSISNAMLYSRLRDAKEVVNGETMHLHLYTCEAELSAALRAQQGSWAGKLDLECKSFQNEDCGVDYKNSESANGIYQVNWNQCISGTPDALRRKFKTGNSLDGLTTRIAIFQMPERHFAVNELKTRKVRDLEMENRLRTWGYKLDLIHGELICPKLVEAAWEWLKDVSDEAKENDDIITDFFDKRVTMYFVRYGIVHNVLRDIDYVEKLQKEGKPLKLRINKQDIEFGQLMADFILMMQIRMFGEQTWNALQNEKREFVPRQRTSKLAGLFAVLPATFTFKDAQKTFNISTSSASNYLSRLEKRGLIKRLKYGMYKKLVANDCA